MADSATAKDLTRPGASFARCYGLALASVAGALLLDLLFHHFYLPHPFTAFALSAIAITFWFGGTKPGIVAVLLSSLIRGFLFEGEGSCRPCTSAETLVFRNSKRDADLCRRVCSKRWGDEAYDSEGHRLEFLLAASASILKGRA